MAERLRQQAATLFIVGSNPTRDSMNKKRLEMGEEAWAEYQRVRKLNKAKTWQKKNVEYYVNYRSNVKRQLVQYKGGKCEDCGYCKDCPSAYHFHHNDPTEKEFTLSHRSLSFETAKIEVDKCRLLCANCHAELHDKHYQQSKLDTIERLNMPVSSIGKTYPS